MRYVIMATRDIDSRGTSVDDARTALDVLADLEEASFTIDAILDEDGRDVAPGELRRACGLAPPSPTQGARRL